MGMKIFTFNIHKGFNWTNTQVTLHLLKEELRTLHPDIVFLQEVVGENKKHKEKFNNWIDNQFEYLAQDLWNDYAYSKHAIYDHRHHGNVILSKYPIQNSEIFDISVNPLEQRSVLYCEIVHPQKVIKCFCVHLNLFHKDRVKQYESMSNFINKKSTDSCSIIIAGDFNDWNQKASKNLLGKQTIKDSYKDLHGVYPRTFPARFPFLCLDRIYTKNLNINSSKVLKDTPWNSFSDHLPILTEVSLL